MNAADGRAMLAFLRQSMAQANDIDNNSNDDDGDPDIYSQNYKLNDPKLKRLVIGSRVETLTFVLQKQSKPDQHLPKSSDEWVKVGEYIGEHM